MNKKRRPLLALMAKKKLVLLPNVRGEELLGKQVHLGVELELYYLVRKVELAQMERIWTKKMVGLEPGLEPLLVVAKEVAREVDLRREETHQSKGDLEEQLQEVLVSWTMKILPLTQAAKNPDARKRKVEVAA